MKVRELSDAEREALRQKGFEKADAQIEALRVKNLSPENYLSGLLVQLERAEYVVTHSFENFTKDGLYHPKDGEHKDDLTDDVIQRMYNCGVIAEALCERLTMMMDFAKASNRHVEKNKHDADLHMGSATVVSGYFAAYK